jgi:predicted lipoprotein with Yx(FWY)xxD motif
MIFGAAITVAACGASAGTSASGASSSPSSASGTASAGAAGASTSSAVTVSTKSVPGVGTVLVNGKGQTLYLLTSEKGAKITCMASNGCTKFWPEIDLPSGVTAAKAGAGVQASLLGTVKGAAGAMEVTYNGWPLYTFIGDSGAGVAKGQGQTSFGGTWYVLNSSGDPVTAKMSANSSKPSSSSTSSSSTSGGSGSNGY